MDMQPWREALAPELTDFTEWETAQIQQHVRDLIAEKEVANFRKGDELERRIGLACFELVSRRHDYVKFHTAIRANQALAEIAASEARPC